MYLSDYDSNLGFKKAGRKLKKAVKKVAAPVAAAAAIYFTGGAAAPAVASMYAARRQRKQQQQAAREAQAAAAEQSARVPIVPTEVAPPSEAASIRPPSVRVSISPLTASRAVTTEFEARGGEEAPPSPAAAPAGSAPWIPLLLVGGAAALIFALARR